MRRQDKETFGGKKLTLSKETLKKLAHQDLAVVFGGGSALCKGPTAIDCSVTCVL